MADRVLIVANGNWPSEKLMNTLIEESDLIVACDGAADRLEYCDVVIGDLDSWSGKGEMEVIKVEDQENSDLSKALNHFDADWVVGIEGGRLDHRLAAYTALCETNSSAILYFDGWRACLVQKEGLNIELESGTKCSLIAFGIVEGIRLTGTEFTLENETLKTGTKGVGNTVCDSIVNISHDSGDLLFIWSA